MFYIQYTDGDVEDASETLDEAIEWALDIRNTSPRSWRKVSGIYQDGVIFMTQEALDEQFNAKEDEAFFYENATDADMDYLCMTGRMELRS